MIKGEKQASAGGLYYYPSEAESSYNKKQDLSEIKGRYLTGTEKTDNISIKDCFRINVDISKDNKHDSVTIKNANRRGDNKVTYDPHDDIKFIECPYYDVDKVADDTKGDVLLTWLWEIMGKTFTYNQSPGFN